MSTVQPEDFGVWAENVNRSYGPKHVLRDMRMILPRGCIYGLLGPSGCGKTTFLNCILGALDVTSGDLLVLGKKPGSAGHGVPGPDVGYMPQNIALFELFTLDELFYFFAKLNNVPERDFLERKEFLTDFLELPRDPRPVGTFSGGQQRRVSLAVTLIHNPALVLLDEPTVGVDPTLRAKIWVYLRRLAAQGTTIIITTHYIEEARQADVVGFIRNGRMLEQGSPDFLIKKYSQTTLEDTFLHLCHTRDAALGDDEEGLLSSAPVSVRIAGGGGGSLNSDALLTGAHSDYVPAPADTDGPIEHFRMLEEARVIVEERAAARSAASAATAAAASGPVFANYDNAHLPLGSSTVMSDAERAAANAGCCCAWGPRKTMTAALAWKSYKKMVRNIGFLIYQFLMPAIQVTLFCLAIGGNPRNLDFGVVSTDAAGPIAQFMTEHIHTDGHMHMHAYTAHDPAYDAARAGNTWGFISFPDGFSDAFIKRYKEGSADPAVVAASTVAMSLDLSNQQISAYLQTEVSAAFEAAILKFAPDATSTSVPIYLAEAVYGSKTAKFTDFIAPGIIVSIAFSQSIGLTALGFVVEKKSGTMDRVYAAGVRPSEIMIAQSVVMMVLLFIQLSLLLMVALLIFALPMKGSLVLVMSIAMLLGMVGMMLGLVIAAGAATEDSANQLVIGTFFPSLLLSGVIWPIEAIPVPLNWISYGLPTTWAAAGMRSAMTRGWGIADDEVWKGLVINLSWFFFLFFCASRNLRKLR
jgi:ABC-type multidrug transport system ATPase subunit/ABC-type multidrug transport system permease subunit